MRKNVKTVYDVIENESHLIPEIVDNNLVVEILKEDLGEMLEVEVALVGEEVKGLLVCQREFEERCYGGKAVVKHLELMEEPIDNRWVVKEHDKEGTMVEG
ncbi:hypothetical protein Tco_1214630 [Tanacetum coccineum]